MNSTISVMLVDDHAIVRAGYRSLLKKVPDIAVIAEAGDGVEAYSQFKQLNPRIVIMDLSLPGQGGLETIARFRHYRPGARIMVFSMHQNPAFALQAARAGALGYITKSSPPEALIRAIYDVHNGKRVLSPDIAQLLALEKLASDRIALDSLTVREFEILRMLVDAYSTQAIADVLHLSPKTVANCHYTIKRKLGVANDIELTRLAIKLNVINLLDLTGVP